MNWTRDWDDGGESQPPAAEDRVDLDWTAWLRTRLEETPQLGPAKADGAVTEEVQGLRQAVEALARERDREVLAGLHALRTVVDSLVEVVADFPSVVRQVLDARTEEPGEAVPGRRLDDLADESALRTLEDGLLALRQDVTASLQELAERTEAMVARQQASNGRSDAVLNSVGQSPTEAPPTVHLDEAQLQAIAAAVADRMRQDSAPTAVDTASQPLQSDEGPAGR